MSNIFELVMIAIAGFATGIFFFGGLWLTVQKGMTSKVPVLWFLGSFILRMSITLGAFFYLTGGILQRLLVCLAGFLIARMAVVKFTKNKQLKRFREDVA